MGGIHMKKMLTVYAGLGIGQARYGIRLRRGEAASSVGTGVPPGAD
jgi:hypothetical protein